MTQFLLVHGAWHGAWCWEKVVPLLAEMGHAAAAIDLPGQGDDPTPAASVTVDDYVRAIGEALRSAGGRSVLVGHSMGGIAISAAAEAHPDLIERLVYVTAFLPRNGESLLALEGRNPEPAVPPSLVMNENEPTCTIREEKVVPLFYHDCSPKDQQWAKSKLTKQALAPLSTELALSAARFGSVPRSYIACTDDRAIGITFQEDMVAASGVERRFDLDASHSPFISRPRELADLLVQAA
jgi:pimeloyl-ACP methyl ester carboxylesterase